MRILSLGPAQISLHKLQHNCHHVSPNRVLFMNDPIIIWFITFEHLKLSEILWIHFSLPVKFSLFILSFQRILSLQPSNYLSFSNCLIIFCCLVIPKVSPLDPGESRFKQEWEYVPVRNSFTILMMSLVSSFSFSSSSLVLAN